MSTADENANLENILNTPFSREMRYGFSEYAKYVIEDRASTIFTSSNKLSQLKTFT